MNRQPCGRHLILFDGECGLCVRTNQFILAHDTRGLFDFASLQSEIGRETVSRFGGDPDALTTFFVVQDYRGESPALLRKSTAALFAASTFGRPWSWLRALTIVPRRIRDAGYDLVARNRYRLFGRAGVCILADRATASRFIDGSFAARQDG